MANTSNMSSETARRKAMGLPPSTSRRENGKVTENDIQEYLAETRAMASKRMSADELENYMYEIEKKTRAENPIKQPKKRPKRGRKKLPTKPKIDLGDSVVVVDKNENVSTVVPPEAKPQGNVSVEAKTQERQGDRQSFRGMVKAGALSLGSSAFNKMFPTLGKGLDVLKSRLEKQEKNTADNNTANKSYSRQVERSSVFLNTISENLNKTNDILQQILIVVNRNAANNQAPTAAGGLGGFPNIDLPDGNRNRTNRRAQTVPDTSPRAKPKMSLGRAGMFGGIAAGAAGLGAWAYSAFSGRGGDNAQPEPPQAAQPMPQAAPPTPKSTPQAAPSASQSPPAAASGTEYDITTRAPIGAPAATVAGGAAIANAGGGKNGGGSGDGGENGGAGGDATSKKSAPATMKNTTTNKTDVENITQQRNTPSNSSGSDYDRLFNLLFNGRLPTSANSTPTAPTTPTTTPATASAPPAAPAAIATPAPIAVNPEYSEEAAAGATRPYINPETPIYDRGEPTPEIPNTENLISSYQEITNRYQSLMDLLNDQGDFAINILTMSARYTANRNFLGRVSTGNNTYDTSIIQRLIANLGNIESRRLELLDKVSIAFRNCIQFRAQLARLQSSNFMPSGINSRIESDNKQLETFVSDYNKLLSDFNSIEENNGREDATPVPSPIPDSQIYDRGEPARERTISDLLKEHRENVEFQRRADIRRQINRGTAHYTAASNLENYSPEPMPPAATPITPVTPATPAATPVTPATPARKQRAIRRPPKGPNSLATAADAIPVGVDGQLSPGIDRPNGLYSEDAAMATRNSRYFAIMEEQRIENLREYFNGLDDKFNGKDASDGSGDGGEEGGAGGDATPKSASQEAQKEDLRENRILNFKADEIFFKADKFEYSEGFQLAAGSPTSTPDPTPGPAAGGEGASSTGGSTPGPAPAASTGAASAAPAAGATGVTQIGSANITGLDFAAGVDQRINSGIANKTKEIQSAFGKKLTVTSGFRDPARNARVGGAGGSKHLTADAVDVQFPGNQQETIDLIKVASEKGAGGIGVYRPGFLHIDTGAKRVWGPDYKATSIPDWAKPALDEHMGKPASQSAGGGAAAGGGETASPMPGGQQQAAAAGAASPSAPAATPEPSAPSSGAAMSSASVADETASRPSAGPTPPPPDATAPITAAPQGPSLPGIDPNNPGSVEPADAAIRYSRLFNIAA
jgi:hypothetical protein